MTTTTRMRLMDLIETDDDAGRTARRMDDAANQAMLITLARELKARGIDMAMPSLGGVPIGWRATVAAKRLKAVTV